MALTPILFMDYIQWHTQEFFFRGWDSTNSVEDTGQRERDLGAVAL
jgi:hypothetical protein